MNWNRTTGYRLAVALIAAAASGCDRKPEDGKRASSPPAAALPTADSQAAFESFESVYARLDTEQRKAVDLVRGQLSRELLARGFALRNREAIAAADLEPILRFLEDGEAGRHGHERALEDNDFALAICARSWARCGPFPDAQSRLTAQAVRNTQTKDTMLRATAASLLWIMAAKPTSNRLPPDSVTAYKRAASVPAVAKILEQRRSILREAAGTELPDDPEQLR